MSFSLPCKCLYHRPGDGSNSSQLQPLLLQQAKQRAALPVLRTGFCSLIFAVSEELKDVHFDLGFAQPLGSTVDAVLGQGDGEPLPSAALHGVIQDSSCGQATTGRQLVSCTLLLLLLQAPTTAYFQEAPASPSTQLSSELSPEQVLCILRALVCSHHRSELHGDPPREPRNVVKARVYLDQGARPLCDSLPYMSACTHSTCVWRKGGRNCPPARVYWHMRGSPEGRLGGAGRRSSRDMLGAGPRLPLHEPCHPGSNIVGLNFSSVDIRKTHARGQCEVSQR